MKSLHAEIMNIRAELGDHYGKPGVHDAFLKGHKQARHAAAELALKNDMRILQLEEALRDILSSPLAVNGMDADLHGDYCDLVGDIPKKTLEDSLEIQIGSLVLRGEKNAYYIYRNLPISSVKTTDISWCQYLHKDGTWDHLCGSANLFGSHEEAAEFLHKHLTRR